MQGHIDSIITALPALDAKLSQISQAQDQDKVCKQVKKYCWSIGLTRAMLNIELTVAHGLLMRGTRIVIPKCLQ